MVDLNIYRELFRTSYQPFPNTIYFNLQIPIHFISQIPLVTIKHSQFTQFTFPPNSNTLLSPKYLYFSPNRTKRHPQFTLKTRPEIFSSRNNKTSTIYAIYQPFPPNSNTLLSPNTYTLVTKRHPQFTLKTRPEIFSSRNNKTSTIYAIY